MRMQERFATAKTIWQFDAYRRQSGDSYRYDAYNLCEQMAYEGDTPPPPFGAYVYVVLKDWAFNVKLASYVVCGAFANRFDPTEDA